MSPNDVSLTGIAHMGRATVLGALIGAVVVAVPVAAALVSLGAGPMSILAAAHVAFFGGMGYGGMLGAVIQADRYERTRGGVSHDRNVAHRREPARRAA